MKRIFLICLYAVSLICIGQSAAAQGFPQIWETSQYDFSQGTKGRLDIINRDGSTSPSPDKAYILAAGVTEGSTSAVTRDLFRLTLKGESTFNSPFPSTEVKVTFANQQQIIGGITGTSGNYIRLWGDRGLSLGVKSAQNLISITEGSAIFSNNIVFNNNTQGLNLSIGLVQNKTGYIQIGSSGAGKLVIGNTQNPGLILDQYSNVYLGMRINDYEAVPESVKSKFNLFVKEGVLSEDYAIAPINSWADFVFAPDYKLRSLSEVEGYIQTNNHLPDIPSAQEVAEEGYSQHELNKALLQKIEELHLYIIQQNKEINELKAQIENSK